MELYGFFIFEKKLAKALSSIHPSQFLFSTTEPGLSSSIGVLSQNYVCLNKYQIADPNIEHFKVIQ